MSSMKLIMESWRKFLSETTNKAFLDEFMPIYNEWQELQSVYGPIHAGPWTNPETGEVHYPEEVQSVPVEDQPEYVRDDPRYYSAHVDHPNVRRATFSQTQKEVKIEKKLLTLFKKYADQNFFNNDVLIYHDLNYRAAIQSPFSSVLKFSKIDRTNYLQLENSVGKDVMSCHGSTKGIIRSGYGMILKGWTIFASREDLGSQTLRTAHSKVREKHGGSGVPKRTSPGRVHRQLSKKDVERRFRMDDLKRKISIKRGKEPDPPLSIEKLEEMANAVVLSADDVSSDGSVEEILVGNWNIDGWFYRDVGGKPWPENFWKKAYEMGIKKPVYAVDLFGSKREVDLSRYFGEHEQDDEKDEQDDSEGFLSPHLYPRI